MNIFTMSPRTLLILALSAALFFGVLWLTHVVSLQASQSTSSMSIGSAVSAMVEVAGNEKELAAAIDQGTEFLVKLGQAAYLKMCPDPKDSLYLFAFKYGEQCGEKADSQRIKKDDLKKRLKNFGWDDVVGMLNYMANH